MRRITEKNKMRCDRTTAQALIDVFGIKIMKDIEIYHDKKEGKEHNKS